MLEGDNDPQMNDQLKEAPTPKEAPAPSQSLAAKDPPEPASPLLQPSEAPPTAPAPRPKPSLGPVLANLRTTLDKLITPMKGLIPGSGDIILPSVVVFDQLCPPSSPPSGLATPGLTRLRVDDVLDDIFESGERAHRELDAMANGVSVAARSALAQVETSSSMLSESDAVKVFSTFIMSLATPLANETSPSTPQTPESNSNPNRMNFATPAFESLRRGLQRNEFILQLGCSTVARWLQSHSEDDPNYIRILNLFGLCNLELYEINWDEKYLALGESAALLAMSQFLDYLKSAPDASFAPIRELVRVWAYGKRLSVHRNGDIDQLERSIELLKICWSLFRDSPVTPADAKAALRKELGKCLLDQYTATGNAGSLDSAIEHLQAVTEDAHTLAHASYERFLQRGDLDDLDIALDRASTTRDTTPASARGYDPDKAATHHAYGLSLAECFKMTLDMQDLDDAVEHCQTAITFLKPAHPLFSHYNAALARIFFARYEAGHLEDLDSALNVIELSVSTNKAGFGQHARVPPEAIQGYLMAVQGAKCDDIHAVRNGIHHLSVSRKNFCGPLYLESQIENYLSRALVCAFRLTASNDDLEMALHYASLAVDKASEGSPYRFEFESELGRLLMISYEHGHPEHFDEAIAHFCSVAMSLTWPSIRLDAAIQWADASERISSPEAALDALETALTILPLLAWIGNGVPIQYRMLASQKATVTNRAAAHALDLGDPPRAVSYMEGGRNILWTQALQLRSEHSRYNQDSEHESSMEFAALSQYLLGQGYDDHSDVLSSSLPERLELIGVDIRSLPPEYRPPDLEAYTSALEELKQGYASTQGRMVELVGADRAHADLMEMTEWRRLLFRQIHQISLHRAAKRWAELRSILGETKGRIWPSHEFSADGKHDLVAAIAGRGSIVVLNVYEHRCDAIIIGVRNSTLEFRHVPLPDISGHDVQSWAEALRLGRRDMDNGTISVQEYEETFLVPILQALWKGLACPLLNHVGRNGEVKRVWWYPTGPFTFIPVHAASPCDGDQPGLPELLISSYITSLHSVMDVSKSPTMPFRILAVGLQETPGYHSLPYVEKEMNSLQRLCKDSPGSITAVIGEEATMQRIILTLRESAAEYTSIHLACHADQDEAQPFRSKFFLYNRALELSQLMGLNLSHIQFAYLSACFTSAGDATLPDECIHLAAGMQFAGVRSVVATMWTANDQAAAMAASRVYKYLFRNGVENANATEAAEALHRAVLGMKKSGVPLAYRVPFIHLGV